MGQKSDTPILAHRGEDLSLKHLNNNLLCALRIDKTGPKPRYDDLIEIAVVPINNEFKPMRGIIPFLQTVAPKRKWNLQERIESGEIKNVKQVMECCNTGIAWDEAQARFDSWFERLNMARGKKISLLVSEWENDREFVEDWLGFETYVEYFDHRVRDVSIAALYCNDKADYFAEPCPYPKTYLRYLASQLQLDLPSGQATIAEECLMLMEVWKRMMKGRF